MSQPPPTVLSFAASDSTGGAGIQADILTLASMGCHPLSVITAITIQATAGVDDVMALDPEWVADQARAVLEDMPVNVFKIGMLGSVEIIAAIAEVISDYPNIPLVLDPVLASGRGDELANDEWVWRLPHVVTHAHLRIALSADGGVEALQQLQARAAELRAALGLARRLVEERAIPGRHLAHGGDVARVVRESARGSHQECFFALLLDVRHRILGLRVISRGTLARSSCAGPPSPSAMISPWPAAVGRNSSSSSRQ